MKKRASKNRIILTFMLLFSADAQALNILSINTEWLWDDEIPHEGRVVKPNKRVHPPTHKEFQLETYVIAQQIKLSKANIVALIEIENENVANTIAKHLGDHWKVAFKKGRDSFTGQDVAILTTYDIIPDTVSNFPSYIGESRDSTVKKTPSKVLGVALQNEEVSYYVIAAHLISKRGPNDQKRFAQADAIRQALVASYGKYNHYIVMGDMNDTPGSNVLRRLKGEWDPHPDLVQIADTRGMYHDYSYIYSGNKQLIDHILIDSELAKSLEFFTLEQLPVVSDHRAVGVRTAN